MKLHPKTTRTAAEKIAYLLDIVLSDVGEPADLRLRAEFDAAIAAANAGIERACAALRAGAHR